MVGSDRAGFRNSLRPRESDALIDVALASKGSRYFPK
jgi:hypothetical protein